MRETGQNEQAIAAAWDHGDARAFDTRRRRWNGSGRKPVVSEETVQWTTSFPEWADPKRQEESDRQFVERLKAGAPSQDLRAPQQVKARERLRRDQKAYSPEELREIESLYQVANRQWQTEEARNSLKTLIEKYKKANRTGCAILYLGQMSGGEEQVDYLKQAIADFGDCFYGDGVQVGALARYFLGHAYLKSGKADEAKALFEEIRRDYPDSVDHSGRSLVEQLPM